MMKQITTILLNLLGLISYIGFQILLIKSFIKYYIEGDK